MADESPKKKRKREETLEPRITYHTPMKTFEWLFHETSLEDTKRVVRRKLGLADNAKVQLAQIRGGNAIVLEDDNDFQAFCVTLKANLLVDVQVTLSDAVTAGSKHNQGEDAPALKKRKVKRKESKRQEEDSADNSSEQPALSTATAPPDTDVSISMSSPKSPSEQHMSPTALFLFPALAPAPTIDATKPAKHAKSIQKVVEDTNSVERLAPEKEKKEKPKKSRKSEPPLAVTLSPASREKAAAILQRHRDGIAERAKQPKKRVKKDDISKEKEQTKDPETAPPKGDKEIADSSGATEKLEVTKKKKKKSEVEKRSSPSKEAEEPVVHIKEHVSSPIKSSKKAGKTDRVPVGGKTTKDKTTKTPKAKSPVDVEGAEDEDEEETHKTPTSIAKQATREPVVLGASKAPRFDAKGNLTNHDSLSDTNITNASKSKRKSNDPVPCPICEQPYHLRFRCPMVQKGGKPLEDRLKVLRREGKKRIVKDVQDQLDTEKRRNMLNVLHGLKPSDAEIEFAIFGNGASLSDTENDVVMQDKGDEGDSDIVSIRSMPESVTRSERRQKSSVRVERPGEGSDSASSDDTPLVDESNDQDEQSSSREATPMAQRTRSHIHISPSVPSSPTNSRKTATIRKGKIPKTTEGHSKTAKGGTKLSSAQGTSRAAQILVQGSSTEEEGSRVADKVQTEVVDEHIQGDVEIDDLQALFRHTSPPKVGKSPGTPGRISGMRDRNGISANAPAEDSGAGPQPISPAKPSPSPRSQQTATSSFLPSLANITSLFRSGGALTGSPRPRSQPTPVPSVTPTPTSVPRPITIPKDSHDKIVEDSSSESESSSDDDDADKSARIPKNQRATSRLGMQPRKSLLSQLP